MSLYKVHFTWKGKELQLSARSLDLTHPYFVSIKDLVFATGPKLIINPAEDDVYNAFGSSRHLMIPFQAVQLIEELPEEAPRSRVHKFMLVEGDPKEDSPEGGDKESGSPEET